MLMTVAAHAALYATAVLLGAMAFFSFVVAPTVFMTLEAAAAATLIRALFRPYYMVILATAFVAGVALLLAGAQVASFAMGMVALLAAFARFVLMPRINLLRDAELQQGDAEAGRQFKLLHRLSVLINVAQLATAAVVLAGFVR